MRGIVAALLLTSAGGFATRRTLLRLSVQSRGVPDSAAPPAPSLRSDVASFKVMDVVESAQALEAEGHRVYHLEVGQPSTGAPAAVKRAAARALDTEKLGYTQSKGIPELREAIIKHYYEVGGIPEGSLDPERLVITTGSSGGFLLAFAACFDKDDHVAVGSTCYPCYRNILESMDCHPAIIQLNKEFKLTATQLRAEVERRKDAGLPPLKGVIQSSPSNPTGTRTRKLFTMLRSPFLTFVSTTHVQVLRSRRQRWRRCAPSVQRRACGSYRTRFTTGSILASKQHLRYAFRSTLTMSWCSTPSPSTFP
uniref:Aminotransferase class I/classII large domain-containing protein n=1 Tax=Phaeomonas parva TaxID=124430 RepID=A0A7S1U2I8_9STRA|mmetsp:Transcript_28030/g.89472  ORF Transcript_28030/g.89472 Transcript_28030/m.89472 type:complete len:309 (+) Transcript_28030:186-1112(+)